MTCGLRPIRPLVALGILALVGCGGGDDAPPAAEPGASGAALITPADEFWLNMAEPCGQAFPGGLTLEPPGDPMLTGEELLVVHFRSCSERELLLPFHIELDGGERWDRSRTWVYTRLPDGRLELRHDHRNEDGTDDEVTWYGGFTVEPGTANRQEFLYDEDEFPGRGGRGWRIEIEPNVRYTYGTIRGGEWTWRIDFDLSRPMAELPPPPWGHEEG